MKNPFIAFLILFSSYAIGQNSSAETPKIGIKIPLGKTLEIKGVSIKFLEVVEDSRCPKGVECIWAGRAIVKVEITSNGKKEEKNLIMGQVRQGEEKNTTLFSSKDFMVKGLTLNPYPAIPQTENIEYVLVVSEEQAEN